MSSSTSLKLISQLVQECHWVSREVWGCQGRRAAARSREPRAGKVKGEGAGKAWAGGLYVRSRTSPGRRAEQAGVGWAAAQGDEYALACFHVVIHQLQLLQDAARRPLGS